MITGMTSVLSNGLQQRIVVGMRKLTRTLGPNVQYATRGDCPLVFHVDEFNGTQEEPLEGGLNCCSAYP